MSDDDGLGVGMLANENYHTRPISNLHCDFALSNHSHLGVAPSSPPLAKTFKVLTASQGAPHVKSVTVLGSQYAALAKKAGS